MTSTVANRSTDPKASATTAKPARRSGANSPPAVIDGGTALSLVQTLAARSVLAVLAGSNADAAIAKQNTRELDGAARSALSDLVLGTLRFLGELRAIVRQFVRAKPDPQIEAVLWVAVYQLTHSKTASHVIVSQAVEAAQSIDRGAKGFVNAVLRNFLRAPDQANAKALEQDEAQWNHPQWWIDRVRADHPERWEAILRGGNGQGPLTLRVNRRRTTQAALLDAFAKKKIEAEALGEVMIVVKRPRPVQRMPGFTEGWFSVQDAGAQLAAPLLNVKNGMRVLDACAAPGGKTAHILELADCELTALDVDAERVKRIDENLARLGLKANVRASDALDVASWWDGKAFDRILLDAPCTGSGVVRRHPDGKWLKRETDIAQLAKTQAALIDALLPTLAVGGRMLYCTCSVFRAENALQIEAALARHRNLKRIRINLPGDPASSGGQLLPSGNKKTHNHDGFFYALLEKTV
jgi:16S rRNA (cytosine967-C5)-methyltransferase